MERVAQGRRNYRERLPVYKIYDRDQEKKRKYAPANLPPDGDR